MCVMLAKFRLCVLPFDIHDAPLCLLLTHPPVRRWEEGVLICSFAFFAACGQADRQTDRQMDSRAHFAKRPF